MNLFVCAMLTLLLADNLMLLLLGWEGVGLCSYLLIGFFYKDEANGQAASKAFIVTRVGDTAMLMALFLLFARARHAGHPGSLAARRPAVPAGFGPVGGGGVAVAGRGRGQVRAASRSRPGCPTPWRVPRR